MRSPLISFKARNTATYDKQRQVTHNPPMNSACFRWAIEKVGGFREEPGYPEDLDLDARIIARGTSSITFRNRLSTTSTRQISRNSPGRCRTSASNGSG